MHCAPVLLITLCRFEHLKKCIESLQGNRYAIYTDLYIGLDYPKLEQHQEGYEKVKKYLEQTIKGFAHVYIIRHEKNQGWYRNFCVVRDKIYEKYDRYIFTEDDNEFSPNFLEYMNKSLSYYETDNMIMAVSGYSYPFMIKGITGNVFTSNIYFSAWGYGIWKDKEISLYKMLNKTYFEKQYLNRKLMLKLYQESPNQYCNFVKGMLEYVPDLIEYGDIRKIDLSFGLYMFFSKKKMIFPTISKVRNCGYDGSGNNCAILIPTDSHELNHRNYEYSKQPIDEKIDFDQIECEKELSQKQINALLASFFTVLFKEKFKTRLAYILSLLCGIKKMKAILKFNK